MRRPFDLQAAWWPLARTMGRGFVAGLGPVETLRALLTTKGVFRARSHVASLLDRLESGVDFVDALWQLGAPVSLVHSAAATQSTQQLGHAWLRLSRHRSFTLFAVALVFLLPVISSKSVIGTLAGSAVDGPGFDGSSELVSLVASMTVVFVGWVTVLGVGVTRLGWAQPFLLVPGCRSVLLRRGAAQVGLSLSAQLEAGVVLDAALEASGLSVAARAAQGGVDLTEALSRSAGVGRVLAKALKGAEGASLPSALQRAADRLEHDALTLEHRLMRAGAGLLLVALAVWVYGYCSAFILAPIQLMP